MSSEVSPQLARWSGIDSVVAKRVTEVSQQCIEAYRANPLLIREHANIERGTAEGGYGRRQLYELVQNGADQLLGASGRIEVILTHDALYCANEGSSIDLSGIEALLCSHLSSKRGWEIGRFGLGFKSVLGITDSPEFYSRSGSFVFSKAMSRERISKVAASDRYPILRLGYPINPAEAATRDSRKLNSFTLDQRAPGLRRNDSPVAILCRSNAHALLLSREMFELKLPHVVQRDQTERCMPAWLANLFRGLDSPELTRSEFLDLFARIQPQTHVGDPGDAWSILKRIDRSKGKEIHLVRLNEGIRSGNVPDELVQATVSKIVLSTIHRSKGLEFPNVMISDPVDAGDGPDDSDVAEEARILYVAMTRAKRSLERLNGPNGCRAGKDKNDRCRLYTYRNGFALVNSIEIRGGDCQALDPAGAFGFDGDVQAIQAYLQNSVGAGDPVELTSVDVMDAEHVQRKHYVVQHAGNYIGITSIDAFHQMQVALWPPKAFGKFELHWPSRIGGLHVETVDTVAGSPATSRKHGLGISGLWLRVRVSGLGTLHFESEYQQKKRG